MVQIYGHKWTGTFGARDRDNVWARGLADLKPEQLAIGFSRCVAGAGKGAEASWPPSLPEFRAMCLPSAADCGLPALEDAFREACTAAAHVQNGLSPRVSHPAVLAAMRDAGTWELTHLPQARALDVFRGHYEALVRRVLAGEPVDLPTPKALPSKPETRPATPEQVGGFISQMRATLRKG